MSDNTNLNEMTLLEEEISYDPTAELNPTIMVPDGINLAEISLGSKGVSVRADRNGKPFIMAHVVAKMIAPGQRYDNRRVSSFPTSIVFNSGTSAIHQLLKAVGAAPPTSCTLGQLKALLESVLQGNPQCNIRTRWEVRAQTKDGGYETVARGMRNFKQLGDGTYSPRVEHNGETLEARENVTDYQPFSSSSNASAQ